MQTGANTMARYKVTATCEIVTYVEADGDIDSDELSGAIVNDAIPELTRIASNMTEAEWFNMPFDLAIVAQIKA